MNMLIFEIKRRLVSVLIWAMAICLTLWDLLRERTLIIAGVQLQSGR